MHFSSYLLKNDMSLSAHLQRPEAHDTDDFAELLEDGDEWFSQLVDFDLLIEIVDVERAVWWDFRHFSEKIHWKMGKTDFQEFQVKKWLFKLFIIFRLEIL